MSEHAAVVDDHLAMLRTQGYVRVPEFAPASVMDQLDAAARTQLLRSADPVELEADLQYPGAPVSRQAAGGRTPRRLLDAYGRDPDFAAWGTAALVRGWMERYFGETAVLSRVHHNCLMTKFPRYGSATHWHRDIRYWSFMRPDLISVWLALGDEHADNGGLQFLPGSHRLELGAERFDAAGFLRADLAANASLLDTAASASLERGDAILFHCNTLHSANVNRTDEVKLSLVYAYYGRSNAPVPGTRSDSRPGVVLE